MKTPVFRDYAPRAIRMRFRAARRAPSKNDKPLLVSSLYFSKFSKDSKFSKISVYLSLLNP
jgi:hypothetical protein